MKEKKQKRNTPAKIPDTGEGRKVMIGWGRFMFTVLIRASCCTRLPRVGEILTKPRSCFEENIASVGHLGNVTNPFVCRDHAFVISSRLILI